AARGHQALGRLAGHDDAERRRRGEDARREEQVGHHDDDATRTHDMAFGSGRAHIAASSGRAAWAGRCDAARNPITAVSPQARNSSGAFSASTTKPPSIGSSIVGPTNVLSTARYDSRCPVGAVSIASAAWPTVSPQLAAPPSTATPSSASTVACDDSRL